LKRSALWMCLMLIVVIVLPYTLSDFGVYLAAEIYIMAIFAMSLGFIMGYAGMVSLGHAAFFGLGAYTVAILGTYVTNMYVLILAAVVLSGLVAMLTGAVFIRTSHFYFLMITFAFGQLLYVTAWQLKRLTGGADGKSVPVEMDFGFGPITSPLAIYYVMAASFVLVLLVVRLIVNSPAGNIMRGIMENESRINFLGYNVRTYKILAYTIAGALGGFAGALYAYYNAYVSPELTHWMNSGIAMLMVIIGGVGTLIGPFIGAVVFILLKNYISTITSSWHLIMGLILVTLVLVGRGGIVHWYAYLSRKLSGLSARWRASGKHDSAEGMKSVEHTEN